jgi:hypothetical protein
LEIYGPDWLQLTDGQVECLVKTIHTTELFGESPDMYGFVGTQRIDHIVGGYLALQYEKDDIYYNKRKELSTEHTTPFERVFFMFFAKTGKILFQNTKFVGLPLNMHMALTRLRYALDQVLAKCGMSKIVDIYTAPDTTPEQDFAAEFERSSRVVRLVVTNIVPGKVPEDFVYYNPQRDRNAIIRQSHQHDYTHLKKVDLEAKSDGDLKQTHLRDLIPAARLDTMVYYVGEEEFIMRREAPSKFEFSVDMEAEQLPKAQMQDIVEMLRRERGVYINTPTSVTPSSAAPQAEQLSIFDQL